MHLKYISSTRIFSSRFTKIFLLFCACAFIGSSIGKIVSHNTARQTAASAQSSNWGLSFQEEGKRPVGNANDRRTGSVQCLFCWRYRRKRKSISPLTQALKMEILLLFWMHWKNIRHLLHFFVVGNFISENKESDQTNGNGRAYCRQSYYDAPGYVKNFHKRIFSERIIRCRKNYREKKETKVKSRCGTLNPVSALLILQRFWKIYF